MMNKISKYLIYLLIITIPFTHKEMFSIIDPDLVYSKFILVLISCVGVFTFFRDYKKFLRDKLFVLLFSIVLFQILSLFQSRDLMNSVRMILFQGAVVFSYPVFNSYFKFEKGSLRILITLYKYTFLFVFAFLLYQMYLQENFGKAIGGVWPVPEYPTRYGSVFWDINHFGAYLSSLFFLVIASLINEKNNFRKFFDFLFIFLILIALYFTSSRSATIGFVFGLIAFLVLYFLTYRNLKIRISSNTWFFSGILSVVLPLSFLSLFQDAIRDSFLYRAVSFFSHLFLLKVGVNVGLENFVFGIGTNSFHAYFHDSKWANAYYYIDQAALSYKLPLHNVWLEVFAETGAISLIFFAMFWALLLYMLYKACLKSVSLAYSSPNVDTADKSALPKNRNILPAGLFAGIISFLVGGFMYSYKSEFFWIYVVIACSYASYYSHSESIKLPKLSFDFLTLPIIHVFSFLSLLIPLYSFMSPLNPSELMIIYSEKSTNLFISYYQYFLDLFRFIFGNFSFTERAISLIFYIGSFLLLFGIFRKTCKSQRAFVSTAIVFNLVNLFTPGLYVSTKWIVCFITLICMHLVVKFVKLGGPFVCHLRWTNKVVYMIVLISTFIFAVASAYEAKSNEYNSDLSFLAELASNRMLFEGSSIWVDTSVDLPLVHYYCDFMDKNGLRECNINVLDDNEMLIANAPKMLIIGKSDFVSNLKLVGDAYSHGENYLVSGDYKMLVFD